ncbi:MAG: serine/threonine protein kinase [Bdellovibrionales bacterium]|nr:serine/threonine protein kinase [Bdellovibrionales bacterium]
MKSTVGPYTLVAKLGEGGMAEVFKAIKPGPGGFEKPLALKRILPPYHDRSDMISMFQTEAKIHSQLSHPKLLNLIDFFQEENSFVLVMEYFRSKNLSQVMLDARRQRILIPWQASLFICSELLEALQYAHNKKDANGPLRIVHRDISPQNILISEEGWVKLSDFGIALANIERDKTATGLFKGKVKYLSPEQIEKHSADYRSDLFSTGIVLYEMICGCHPFYAKSDFEIMNQITAGEYKKPAVLAPQVPQVIHNCIDKALSLNPEDRFQSAKEMRDNLLTAQELDWNQSGHSLLMGWLENIYKPDQMHNETPISSTVILGEQTRISKKQSYKWIPIFSMIAILGMLGMIVWYARLHLPSNTSSHVTSVGRSILRFSGQEGSTVYLNGKIIGKLPMQPYTVDPGSYVVLLVSPKKQTTIKEITLQAGDHTTVNQDP